MRSGYPGELGSNRARRTALHRQRGGRPADRCRAAGAPDRVRARPAGAGADGLFGAAEAQAAPRPARSGRDRAARPRAARRALPREAGNPPLPREHGEAGPGARRRRRRGVRRRRRAGVGRRHRHHRPEATARGASRLRRDEGEGALVRAGAALRDRDGGAARPGSRDARRRGLAGGAGRVPAGEARLQGVAPRRSRLIELRFYRDGGQSAVEVAKQVAEFVGAARTNLELALYDIRLHDDAAEIVTEALLGAQARGVAVRLIYNVDHPGPIPVPPPPQTTPELLEALPIPTRPIPGVPDLMHHKYVLRDRETVWTGSLNWSQDSWTRPENAVVIVDSPELAYAYGLNFEELWETGDAVDSGKVEPRPVEVGEVEVRPWFSPEHGEALAHRIAKRLGQARRRIRIASPVLSSGPILGTLAEVCSDGKVDVAGVVDDTQVDGVLEQWRLNGNASWKVPRSEEHTSEL